MIKYYKVCNGIVDVRHIPEKDMLANSSLMEIGSYYPSLEKAVKARIEHASFMIAMREDEIKQLKKEIADTKSLGEEYANGHI